MFARSRLRFSAAGWLIAAGLLVAPLYARALVADAGLPSEQVAPAAEILPDAAERRAEAMARVAAGSLAEDAGPDAALAHYRRALDLDPANAPLASQVASMLLQHGEVPEALGVLKDAYKCNPGSAALALRIAGIYVVSLRKFEPAERYAAQALQSAPDFIEPYQLLYSIRVAAGRPDAAQSLLRQAAGRRNEDPEFWAGLGDLCMRQALVDGKGRDEAASAAALAHYRRAADLGRQDPVVLQRALSFFFGGSHYEDAVSCARRLLVLQPDDTLSREKLALVLSSLGRDDEAVAELEAVVAENPASLLAYRAHGEILLRRGDTRGAVSKFEKALALHDEDPRLYLELADLCLKAGDTERAAHWLGEAREKFGRLPELPFYEGQLLAQLKRWREALNAFDLAADLASKYQPSFLTADFHFQHGVMAERAGEHDAAARHLQACLALDGGHAEALNYLGYMWAERGENLASAESYIRRALEREPDNPAFLDSLGWVLHQQGRYHEALAPLERAAKLADEPDSAIEEHLGDVLDKLGRRQEALKAWERAAALEGASPALPAKLQSARNSLGQAAAEIKAGKP